MAQSSISGGYSQPLLFFVRHAAPRVVDCCGYRGRGTWHGGTLGF